MILLNAVSFQHVHATFNLICDVRLLDMDYVVKVKKTFCILSCYPNKLIIFFKRSGELNFFGRVITYEIHKH